MAEYTIYRFIQMLTYISGHFIIMYLFTNRFLKKISLNKKMVFKILLGICLLLMIDYFGFSFETVNTRTIFSIILIIFDIMVYTIVLLGIASFEVSFTKILFINTILEIAGAISVYVIFELIGISYYTGGFFLFPISTILFEVILFYFLSKTKMEIVISNIFNKRYIRILFIFLSYTYYAYSLSISYENDSNLYIMAIIYSILIMLLTVYFYYNQNKKLNKTIMLQQEEYIKSLESMQEGIRKYNHDYKNLLTGALLQAEEGDYEGVQKYLQDVLDEFELKLGKQISKNKQLKKINSNELKGMILSKMSEMEDKGIEFHLEVLNEVSKINMRSTDLVRCLGILIDNAIEEVERINEKIISLVILEEENITTIMVKNPVTEKVNIQSIYEDNFSTKGAKRGLGLSNYREIIENYENIVRETACTEEEFNQVLKIG